MEETLQKTEYNPKNVELLNQLESLILLCTKDNFKAIKIKRIKDYCQTTYPEVQKEFEERFPANYKLNGFKNHINILDKILNSILSKNAEDSFFLELDEKNTDLGFLFIKFLFKYLDNKIELSRLKGDLFLIAHEIDPSQFKNLNETGIISLCEMSENGVDVSVYSNSGNLKLSLLNDAANGKFKEKQDELLKRENIISAIEDGIDGCYMQELEYDKNFSLIFEQNEEDGVSIYTSLDINRPIAIVNSDGDFIKGSINDILLNVHKNVRNKNEEVAKNANTIDNIILGYNNLVNEEKNNQSDLASALRMALELEKKASSSNNN